MQHPPLHDAAHDVLVPDHRLPGALVLVAQLLPLPAEPLDEADHGLGGGHDVEGRRQGGAGLEVADPELGPGELPLPATSTVTLATLVLSLIHI